MGNNKIHKLSKPKRLFAAGADHKHSYSQSICVKIVSPVDERYYKAQKCDKCDAMLLGDFLLEKPPHMPTVILTTNHKWRIDMLDLKGGSNCE